MGKQNRRWTVWLLILVLAATWFALAAPAAASTVTQTRTEGISAFPESYQPYLEALQETYPSWSFVAFDTGLTWEEVLAGEMYRVDNNLAMEGSVTSWRSLADGAFDWENNTFYLYDGSRYAASREIIAHRMDPRNSLTDLRRVFQFEQLSFDPSTQTEAGVTLILMGTFMYDSTAQDAALLPEFSSREEEGAMTYAQAFMAIAAELNVSPYHLASRVRQEQGSSGSSSLISGTYAGYEGYYNYFNIGATGSTTTAIIENGLARAKNEGWDTAYKSLLGGASLIADKYIGKGQDTLYLQKFDVAAEGGMYSHQYMQNVSGAYSESVSVYNSYSGLGLLDASFTFVIPVYHDMPEEPCPLPTADGNPNYKLQSLGISEGTLDPDFDLDTLTYTATVGNDVHTVTVGALPIASTTAVSGTGSIGLAVGENVISVTTTAERGDTCTYTLRVTRLADGEVILAMGSTTANVNLRAEPGTDGEILVLIPQGRNVSILAEADGWYQVIYGEYTGYVSAEYIDIYVPATGLSLAESTLSLEVGTPGQLTAITEPDPCDTEILWKSENEAIATVENGLVTPLSTGEVIITAYTDNGLSATCTVTVSEPVLFLGTVTTSGSNKLNVRDNPSTSGSTVLGGLSNGTVVSVVEVTDGWYRILYEDTTAWVSSSYVQPDPVASESVALSSQTGQLSPGSSLTLTATMTPVYSTDTLSWSTSDAGVATVTDGVVTAVSTGTATITVTTSSGKTAACTVTVSIPATDVVLDQTQLTLYPGETFLLQATLTPADSTDLLSWQTGNQAVALAADGLVTAVGAGSTTVTVTASSGKTATCTVTVEEPVLLMGTVNIKSTSSLNVRDNPSTDSTVLGKLYSGDAVSVVEILDGWYRILFGERTGWVSSQYILRSAVAADSITLTPDSAALDVGQTVTLTGTVLPTYHTDTLSWSSSDPSVASVTDGTVTALSTGTAVITLTASSGQTATCTVTVAHTYVSQTVAPTCTQQGYTLHTCSGCGHVATTDVCPATGHTYSDDADNSCDVCGAFRLAEEVLRIFGSNRYDTAFGAADLLADIRGTAQVENIIVACGTNFADALAGSYLSSVKNAPILLVQASTVALVQEYILTNLQPGGTVYLLGGEGAVPAAMEDGLDQFSVKRLWGANRYETNLAILREAGVTGGEILICTGHGFADSLSASAVGKPILLVDKKLSDGQRDFLDTLSDDSYCIVGGVGAVNAAVESALQEYGSTTRLAGANRYATSVMVAERFFDAPACAVLAYAANFPDGLCGGPLAMGMGAPLLLTDNRNAAIAAAYTADRGITCGVVLGGTALIGDAAVREIFSMEAADSILIP